MGSLRVPSVFFDTLNLRCLVGSFGFPQMHFSRQTRVASGLPLGSLWLSPGFLLGAPGSLWVPSGFPLGSLWVPSGIPLGSLWDPSGFPLGSLWVPSGIPLGSSLGSLWVPFGFPQGFLWVPPGFPWLLQLGLFCCPLVSFVFFGDVPFWLNTGGQRAVNFSAGAFREHVQMSRVASTS